MKKETGKNISSGAEKVERVEFTQENVDPSPVKKTANGGTMSASKTKKTTKTKSVQTPETAELREETKAQARVEAARDRNQKKAQSQKEKLSAREKRVKKRTDAKEKKLQKRASVKEKKLEHKHALLEKKEARRAMLAKKKAERIEAKEKRAAELKARKVERRAERIARKELLKNETKAERAKRIEREKREQLALRRRKAEAREKARENKLKAREAAHVRKAEERRHKREHRREHQSGGYGGWLAAVISLGTACLILGGVITAGAFRMNEMNLQADGSYLSTVYGMVGVSESLDDSLSKLRVSTGLSEQRRLLTDVVVDTALIETAVERMPLSGATGAEISSFVNRINEDAKTMLSRLAEGKKLTGEDRERIAGYYSLSDELYQKINSLAGTMSAKDAREFFMGGGEMMSVLSEAGKKMHAENDLAEAPFSEEGNVGENRLMRLDEVSSAEAEELAKKYFEAYHIADVKYTGETVTKDMSLYDIVLTDENGLEIFAQITKRGGKLAFFDTYEECLTKNFDLRECDALAREFLAGLGIGNVEAVWLSDGGMVANLTYTTVEDGVRIYPELLRVRVCEEKGRVVGLDAHSYLLNDKTYSTQRTLSREEAEQALADGMQAYSCNLALIPVDGREVMAYEFGCMYGEQEYLVYVDANTGEEVKIYRVMASARGSYLK